MATHEKPKRGFMSFYKSSNTKKHTPKFDPIVVVDKPAVYTLSSTKSENCQELVVDDGKKRLEGGGGRRKMVVEARKSVSHAETNLASVATFLQVKVLVSDMPGFMQVHAFRCARRSYDGLETSSSKHIAHNIKKEFDKVYGPAWHCIVGLSFGSFVTHATGCFLYFSMDKLYILVFKTKVERAVD